MPDRSRQPKPTRSASTVAVILAAMLLVLLILVLTTSVTAQGETGDATPGDATAQPTSEFDFSLAPTFAFESNATVDPNQIPSLTGVGGHAVNASVIIRSGPGLDYRQISYLKQDGWIDIVGWNGWDEGRDCSTDFKSDLDMWVQVQFGERRGWIARCVLDIRGQLTKLPIVTESGERILQR